MSWFIKKQLSQGKPQFPAGVEAHFLLSLSPPPHSYREEILHSRPSRGVRTRIMNKPLPASPRSERRVGQQTFKQVPGSRLMPTVRPGGLPAQLRRCPHLVHTDVVPRGALDHWGVVIDVQDGHLQDVVLLPWRGATVRRHNLGGRGRRESGLNAGVRGRKMDLKSAICSVGRAGGADRLAAHPCPWGPASSGLFLRLLPPAPCCQQFLPSSCLIWDPHLQSDMGVPGLHPPILPLTVFWAVPACD